ncbi:MAG: carbohydrate-binding domain-containing protein, partial [Actinomycetia bacterium]|nr:carbohydrate-binding domain-containing protein [Actinomycetes bacterium]
TITVTAVNDGIKGRDCIGIKDGVITVDAGGDGLQANNDADADQGYIDIQGGILDITAGTDGIQAETTLLVGAGDLTLSTGGGSVVSSSDADGGWGDWGRDQQGGWPGSTTDTTDATTGGGTGAAADTTSATAKGLKAGGAVFVEGGTIVIDSSDDSIHSNGAVRIDGGSMTLTSGDDGIHSDATLEINGGDVTITKSYEGIESAVITINDGSIHVVAADDGLNVAGGVDSSSINGRRGQGDFTVNENNKLYINGGYVAVDAAGDGIDCNGRMFMTAGTLLVNGPTNDGNGALDYLGEFTVTGGYIVAAGSAGMAQAPSESSTQYSLMVNFDTVQTAGTLVHIQDESGADIVTFAPTKEFRSFVVSSPDIKEGGTYIVYVGGSSAGTATDGLYPEGTYTPGEEYATLTVSGVVTTYGSFGGMMPGGRGGTLPDGGTMPGGGTRPGGRGDTAPGGSALDTTSTTAVTF